MRARYTLTATRDGRTAQRYIEADSDSVPEGLGSEAERLTFDATTTAVMEIMNAATTQPLWARGRIELRDAAGDLVHEMDEK